MSAATKQKSKVADPALSKLQREWHSWSNDRLQKALEKGLRNIASSIREIATALGILESRGQTPKCTGYSRIFSILRRVYRGDTTADIVTRFFGNSPFL